MEPGASQLWARGFLPHNQRTRRFFICLTRSAVTSLQPIPSDSTGGIRQQFFVAFQPTPPRGIPALIPKSNPNKVNPLKINKVKQSETHQNKAKQSKTR
jgi:hypothetical protein